MPDQSEPLIEGLIAALSDHMSRDAIRAAALMLVQAGIAWERGRILAILEEENISVTLRFDARLREIES